MMISTSEETMTTYHPHQDESGDEWYQLMVEVPTGMLMQPTSTTTTTRVLRFTHATPTMDEVFHHLPIKATGGDDYIPLNLIYEGKPHHPQYPLHLHPHGIINLLKIHVAGGPKGGKGGFGAMLRYDDYYYYYYYYY